MNPYPDLLNTHKILIAKLRHHGDVLLSSPVFSELRERFPNAQIDALIYQETHPMLDGHPAINNFLYVDKRWKKLFFIKRLCKEYLLLRRIKKEKYDLVINLTEGDRGAVAAKVSKASIRVGFDPQGRGMKGKRECYTHIIKHCPKPRHTVEKNLDALRVIGIFPKKKELTFAISKQDAKSAAQKIKSKKGEYILVHPASRWLFKALPVSTIAAIIRKLCDDGNEVVMTSSPDVKEIAMLNAIESEVKHGKLENLGGKTSLKELGALIDAAKMVVTVDSVPLHIASALKKNMVCIFGPSCEKNWGPWNVQSSEIISQDVSCRPCYQPGCGGSNKSDCLESLSAQKIIDAIYRVKSSPKYEDLASLLSRSSSSLPESDVLPS